MPHITFMIGNGFDLSCGLKSRYKDTYDEYISSPSSSDTIEKFKKTIDKDIDSWADFEMKMADYAKKFQSESELIECVRDYTNHLNSHLVNEQGQFLRVVRQDQSIINSVAREFNNTLQKFYYGLTKNDINAITFILNNGPCHYHFICFNYTRTIDTLRGFLKSGSANSDYSEIIHIHGQLGNDDIVLGVNDESQLQPLPYKLSNRGKRVIIKPTFVEQYDYARKQEALDKIAKSNIICAYGLSLGESDSMWREALANWLLSDKDHHLVFYIHKYSKKKYPPASATQKMDDEDDCKEYLINLMFSNLTGEMVDQLNKQIHIPVGTKVFKISETIQSSSKALSDRFAKAKEAAERSTGPI